MTEKSGVLVRREKKKKYKLFCGDATEILAQLPASSVNATITSPPYYKHKDYSSKSQIGQESSIELYIQKLKQILHEIYRVTAKDGSCFLVIGDTYKNRSLLLVPHRLALAALEADWIIRNELIWSKLDPAPDSAANRWRESHEHVFFLTKSRSGYKNKMDRLRVPYSEKTVKRWGKGQIYGGPKAKQTAGPKGQRISKGKKFKLNPLGVIPKDVICTATACNHSKHYASFPELLIEQFLFAATDPKDIVLDPFAGTSTTGVVAIRNGRLFWGIDVNPEYIRISEKRLRDVCLSNSATSTQL